MRAKPKHAEVFGAIWYKCPGCSTENTVRTGNNPYLTSGFRCRKCRQTWTVAELFKVLAVNDLSSLCNNQLFSVFCWEFICDDCGTTNVLLPEQQEVEFHSIIGCGRGIGAEMPRFGVCEECHQGFVLYSQVAILGDGK